MPYVRFLLAFFMSLLISSEIFAAVNYSTSAHGNSSSGVNRTSISVDSSGHYTAGNCAHCHEQHASIEGDEPEPSGTGPDPFLLLSDTDGTRTTYTVNTNACFQCHSTTSVQLNGSITNYDYSGTFAGYPANSPEGILEAFNLAGSKHDLNHVYNYAAKNGSYVSPATDFTYFTDNSNPCTACHNPHIAKANRSDVVNQTLSVLSLPDNHDDLYGDGNNGDGASERMSDFAGSKYQPPYY